MKEFRTDKDALDYLSERISAEAAREGVPLTEVERKMLYFSETDWTLPDMAAVSDVFSQANDEDEYERKITSLVRKIEADSHTGNMQEMEDWNNAVQRVSNGDRYIQIMLDSALKPLGPTARPPHDRLKLWLTALSIVFCLFGLIALVNWLFGSDAADLLFGHNGLASIFVFVVALIWMCRSGLREIFKTLFHRW